jgi:flagellar protein FliT
MDNQEIISLYEGVAEITDQMLLAARNGDWDSLVNLEKICAGHITTLSARDKIAPLSETARQKKIGIIKKILADDHQIRVITEPRLTELSALISNSGTERKLQQAYSANNTG